MRVRQSTLKLFGDCAKQFEFSKLLNLGEQQVGSLTVLGTVWHYAVDVYEAFGHDLDLAKRTFIYYWENPSELGEKIDFWHRQTTHQGLNTRGLKMLEQYHELAPWRTGRRLGSEIHFVVPIGDHELEGTIDKLWWRPGRKRVEVLDFKTGSYVPDKLRFNVQFSAYCYATTREEFWANVPGFEDGHERFKAAQRGGHWYHARNGRMHDAGDRELVDYQRLYLAILEMDNAIERNVFPLTISGETCYYCPFSDGTCGASVTEEDIYGPRSLLSAGEGRRAAIA
jgi:hypothetical protein